METGSIRKSDLEGKYVFWDIDGTLAPYRFNDHVSDPDGTNNGMSLKEISEHIFLTRKPSQHMIKVVYSCGSRRNFIMGHCQVQQEMDDKQLWLDKHFQLLDNKIEYLLLKISRKLIVLLNTVQDIELT